MRSGSACGVQLPRTHAEEGPEAQRQAEEKHGLGEGAPRGGPRRERQRQGQVREAVPRERGGVSAPMVLLCVVVVVRAAVRLMAPAILCFSSSCCCWWRRGWPALPRIGTVVAARQHDRGAAAEQHGPRRGRQRHPRCAACSNEVAFLRCQKDGGLARADQILPRKACGVPRREVDATRTNHLQRAASRFCTHGHRGLDWGTTRAASTRVEQQPWRRTGRQSLATTSWRTC